LAPGPAGRIDEVASGRLGLDGNALVPIGGEIMQQRRRILHGGSVVVTLVAGRDGRLLAEPQLAAPGLLAGSDSALVAELVADVRDAVNALSAAQRHDDAAIKEAARLAVRRGFRARRDKKPVTEVQLVRLQNR
jgi:ribonuclease J